VRPLGPGIRCHRPVPPFELNQSASDRRPAEDERISPELCDSPSFRRACRQLVGHYQPASPSDGRLGAAAGPEFARCRLVAQVRPARPRPQPGPGNRLPAGSHCCAWRRWSSQHPSRVARSRRSSKRHSASQRQTWSNNVSNCVCTSGASRFGRSGSAVLTVQAGIPVFAFLCEGSGSADRGIASIRSVCLRSRVVSPFTWTVNSPSD
jgi:hypothetical protein